MKFSASQAFRHRRGLSLSSVCGARARPQSRYHRHLDLVRGQLCRANVTARGRPAAPRSTRRRILGSSQNHSRTRHQDRPRRFAGVLPALRHLCSFRRPRFFDILMNDPVPIAIGHGELSRASPPSRLGQGALPSGHSWGCAVTGQFLPAAVARIAGIGPGRKLGGGG